MNIKKEAESCKKSVKRSFNLFTGYAVVSQHDIINHKYEQISDYQKQLEQHIGARAAAEVVTEALDQVGHDPEDKRSH